MSEYRIERRIVAALLAWGIGIVVLERLGLFQAIPREFGALLVLIGIAAPVGVYILSQGVREYIAGLGIKALSVFHIWRIGAGLLFVFYGSQGLLPEAFVLNAGYGDIAVGILAAITLAIPGSFYKYWVLHIAGAADFVLAVLTGFYLVMSGDPLMANFFTMPIVLIPLFGVGISGASHVFAFDLLARRNSANQLTQRHA